MKTETQIAEDRIKMFKLEEETKSLPYYRPRCFEHKASCQRFLEFLGDEPPTPKGALKYEDLKQAIKLYEDNGI